MLGFDPLMLACEGRLLAVVAPETAATALRAIRATASQEAAIIGTIVEDPAIVLQTELGERVIEELDQEPLPRIC